MCIDFPEKIKNNLNYWCHWCVNLTVLCLDTTSNKLMNLLTFFIHT